MFVLPKLKLFTDYAFGVGSLLGGDFCVPSFLRFPAAGGCNLRGGEVRCAGTGIRGAEGDFRRSECWVGCSDACWEV